MSERLKEIEGVLRSWLAWDDWNDKQRETLNDTLACIEQAEKLEEQNVTLMNELETSRRSHENTRNSLKKTDAEVIRLTETNYKLTKSNAKMQRNSNDLGSNLLKAKNEIRSLGGNWKQFNKEERKNG